MKIDNKDFKILKEWIIENIETDLSSWTRPKIEKATKKNIEKAIKQQGSPERCSTDYYDLQSLREDLEIFKILDRCENLVKGSKNA